MLTQADEIKAVEGAYLEQVGRAWLFLFQNLIQAPADNPMDKFKRDVRDARAALKGALGALDEVGRL